MTWITRPVSWPPVRRLQTARLCALALMLGSCGLLWAQPAPKKEPSLKHTSVFLQPILNISEQAPDENESQGLEAIFTATKTKVAGAIGTDKEKARRRAQAGQEEIAALDEFARAHPDSAWTPSLRVNLGKHYREQARYTQALEHWQAAWEATRHFQEGAGKQVADYALVFWTRLLADLGHQEELTPVLEQTQDRLIHSGALQQVLNHTREAAGQMRLRPQSLFACGVQALELVARQLKGSKYDGQKLRQLSAPVTGFSLKTLSELAAQEQLNLVAVQQLASSGLVVPSVIHFRQNHYGAILSRQGELYQVQDFVADHALWLDAQSLQAEASGYYLIPSERLSPNWRPLSPTEASQIVGRLNPYGTLNDQTDRNTTNGNLEECTPAGLPVELPIGMPIWRVSEPYINLWWYDEPLGYQPAYGPRISLLLSYKQRDENASLDPGIGSFGTGINCSWLSYVQTFSPDTEATVFLPEGGQASFSFSGDQAQDTHSNFSLKIIRDSSGLVRAYELQRPDGSRDYYDFIRYSPGGTWSQIFLTQHFNPQGNFTRLGYTFDIATSTIRLATVTDAQGRSSQFSYLAGIAGFPNLVSSVSDPFGRSASFFYTATGNLTRISDVAGILSNLDYDPATQWLTRLSTPYGLTTFASAWPFTPEGVKAD